MTNFDRLEEARALYEDVVKRDPSERGVYLRAACGEDRSLLAHVLRLLAHHDPSHSPIDTPAAEALGVEQKGTDSDEQGAGPSVQITGLTQDQADWGDFVRQLKSRGPNHSRYVFQGEIAHGGMGVIHRVYDQDFRRQLALKVILGAGDAKKTGDTPAVDTRSLGRFLEEAQVTGQLDHPGIVPAHELGVDAEENVYFTMKLVRGEELRLVFDRVHDPNDDGWNQTRALSLMLRVCETMAYAHSKGVIHRDLKPSNIMVGKYGETYVMDWGLARVLGTKDEKDLRIQPLPRRASTTIQSHRKDVSDAKPDSPLLTMDGDVVGTPAYMSPEQARGDRDHIGPQSDVYAVGTMLYHLLTGHMPYLRPGSAPHPHAIWQWVQKGPPTPLDRAAPGAPPALTAICDKAMSRAPLDRYGSMSELAQDLRSFLEHRVVAAYESGAIAELKKWVKRNRALAATAGASLVAVLVLSGWALLERQTALSEKRRADGSAEEAKSSAVFAAQRAAEAEAEREMAESEKQRVLRLADVKRLSDLKAQMDTLWPAHPELVPAMTEWLKRAQEVSANLAAHEQTLSDLRSLGLPGTHPRETELANLKRQAAELMQELHDTREAGNRTRLEERVAELVDRAETLTAVVRRERPYEFPDAQEAWWHDTLVSLVSDMVMFSQEDPFGQTVESVRTRKAFAETIEKNSITYYQDEWEEAIAQIADPEECPEYNGLIIATQLGLVPIGRDPDSGLWEFWHVQTGSKPQRNQSGKLVPTEEMGLVFVLIPGGASWMGAQATDPKGRNYYPDAKSNESDNGSPVEVTLDAYFLSKYEMTQGQWQRFTGRNPSYYGAGGSISGHTHSLLNPVEQVSWDDCMETLGRLGLQLATEAQWEYGCRAGMETPWWTGSDKADLDQAANLADQFLQTNGGPTSWLYEPDLNDGFGAPAPVGRLDANGFGLHDVIGNVLEWCLDDYGSYSKATQPVDGRRFNAGASYRVNRGGGFSSLAADARSAYRYYRTPSLRSTLLGCRPAMSLDP